MKPAPETPIWWQTIEQIFATLASGVREVLYQSTDSDGVHTINVIVHRLDSATASEIGRAIAELQGDHNIKVVLGDIQKEEISSIPELPGNCPVCGVPWEFCGRRQLHQSDIRSTASRTTSF